MKLLITGAWRDAKEYIPTIEEMGHAAVFMQQEAEALPCPAEEIEGVICNNLFAHHPIEKFENLRYIQLTSVGYDRAPMDYVHAHGIEIHNAADVYSVPMAEFVLSGVLQLYKRSQSFYEQQKKRIWEKQREIFELSGKTVGIIGCGHVGVECAKRFAAFDAKVVGVNRTPKDIPFFDKIYPLGQLDILLPQCDILVLTIALTDETKGMFDAKRLALLKKSAVLVNVARGSLVDTSAMLRSLKEKKLFGAVLDVFEEEPLDAASELWDIENVILTPHNSFVSEGNKKRLWNVIERSLEVSMI